MQFFSMLTHFFAHMDFVYADFFLRTQFSYVHTQFIAHRSFCYSNAPVVFQGTQVVPVRAHPHAPHLTTRLYFIVTLKDSLTFTIHV